MENKYGLNADYNRTKILTREELVSNHDIKKTLTSSGNVSAKTTEKLTLSVYKYFKAMCVEVDDTVKMGDNILEYSDGTFLTAPYDCVVLNINVPDTGNICTTSHYVELSNLNTLQINVSINENEIANIEKGKSVDIVLNSNTTKAYQGTITKIDSIGSYTSSGTTFTATIEFENDGNVKLGMSVSCTIIISEEKNVASISIDAVSENSKGEEYVTKINDDGTTEDVIIETGVADENYVQIKSGLNLNDKVQIQTEVTENSNSINESNSKDKKGFGEMAGGQMPGGNSGMQSGGDFSPRQSQNGTGGNSGERPSKPSNN